MGNSKVGRENIDWFFYMMGRALYSPFYAITQCNIYMYVQFFLREKFCAQRSGKWMSEVISVFQMAISWGWAS